MNGPEIFQRNSIFFHLINRNRYTSKNTNTLEQLKILDDSGDLTLLILGGNKNGQDSDIKKARKVLKKHIEG